MKAFIEKYKSIILYLVFGALTTAVNIGVFTFLDLYMHWNYQVGTQLPGLHLFWLRFLPIKFGFLVRTIQRGAHFGGSWDPFSSFGC